MEQRACTFKISQAIIIPVRPEHKKAFVAWVFVYIAAVAFEPDALKIFLEKKCCHYVTYEY